MKNCVLILLLLCLLQRAKAQIEDTVDQKIRKIAHKHVDALASFEGGNFNDYLVRQITFSNIKDNVKGEVILLINIAEDGKVSEVDVLKGLGPVIDPIVISKVKSSPAWRPAMLNGKPTSMKMVLRIDMSIIGHKASIPKPKPAGPAPIQKPAATKTTAPVNVAKIVLPHVAAKKAMPKNNIHTPLPVVKKQASPLPKKAPQIVKKQVAPTPPKAPLAKLVKPLPLVAKKSTVRPVAKPAEPIHKKVIPQLAKAVAVPAKKITPPVTPTIVKVIKPPVKAVAIKIPVIAKAKPPAVLPSKPTAKAKIPVPPKLAVIKPKKNKHKAVAKMADSTPVDFNSVGVQAKFPGGDAAFNRFIATNLIYPQNAKVNNIQGQVLLTFAVEPDGSVGDVKVLNSPADDLAQESVRILLSSPKWIPGMQNGIKVRVKFTIPIKFTLGQNQ